MPAATTKAALLAVTKWRPSAADVKVCELRAPVSVRVTPDVDATSANNVYGSGTWTTGAEVADDAQQVLARRSIGCGGADEHADHQAGQVVKQPQHG